MLIDNRVSIIIPIYNVEEFLNDCIESVVKQTYHNIEILLVDDGSTDNSSRIADEWVKKDDRIRVFHKDNGGVSSARNLGINYACGEYLAFVDSDDTIAENYIEFLVKNAEEYNADISICISNIIQDKERNAQKWSGNYFVEIAETDFAIKHLITADKFGCALNKLYRANLWDDYRIDENIRINEDLLANFNVFLKADKICFSSAKYYNYRLRNGSASRSGFDTRVLDILDVNIYITEKLKKIESSNIGIEYERLIVSCWSIYRKLSKKKEAIIQKRLKEVVKKYFRECILNGDVSKRSKVQLLIMEITLYLSDIV